MSMERIRCGSIGEDYAVEFLTKQGYRIMERNFKNTLGEIDIIAEHKGTLCFVEVKTRTSDSLGSPLEGVTRSKQRKLIRVAESYMKFRQRADQKARFDVVAVVLENTIRPKIELVQNAFEIQ